MTRWRVTSVPLSVHVTRLKDFDSRSSRRVVTKDMSLLLSKILKAKLSQAGIGVPTLAKHSHVPRQTISNWLADQKPQNIEHVKAVADFFSMSVDELCFGAPARRSPEARIEDHLDDIHAGVFEIVLRRVEKHDR